MNPWPFFLDLLGWVAVAILVLVVLTIIYAIIAATIKTARARRRHRPRSGETIIISKEDQ